MEIIIEIISNKKGSFLKETDKENADKMYNIFKETNYGLKL